MSELEWVRTCLMLVRTCSCPTWFSQIRVRACACPTVCCKILVRTWSECALQWKLSIIVIKLQCLWMDNGWNNYVWNKIVWLSIYVTLYFNLFAFVAVKTGKVHSKVEHRSVRVRPNSFDHRSTSIAQSIVRLCSCSTPTLDIMLWIEFICLKKLL